MTQKTQLIVALDFQNWQKAEPIYSDLKDLPVLFKVGLELFIAEGPKLVQKLTQDGARIFLDLKLHDIPNTVKSAVLSAAGLGAEMITVHLGGGKKMIESALGAAATHTSGKAPLILGVSVLTSFDQQSWDQVGQASGGASKDISESVEDLVELGVEAGMKGIVCSPLEIALLKRRFPKIKLVVPGIRPEGSDSGDQSRVMTPKQATDLGADFIVVGRPITQASSPRKITESILKLL